MESPQPDPARHLVRRLDPDTPYPERLAAARALGTIETSDVDIVRALLAAKERDPSYQVRQTAAEAVRALAHASVLAQHPELQPAVDAPVRHSMPVAGAAVGSGAPPAAGSGLATGERSPTSCLIPWLTIWIWPRRTIRQIVDTNPRYQFWIVTALAGFARSLDAAWQQNLGDHASLLGVLGYAAVLGPIGWISGVYFTGSLVGVIGRRLGGVAEPEDVRAALAWSAAPSAVGLGGWILGILVFGRGLFTSTIPSPENNPFLVLLLVAIGFLFLVLNLWQIVLFVLTVAEVHRFSIWRSLLTWSVLIAAAVLLVGAVVALTA